MSAAGSTILILALLSAIPPLSEGERIMLDTTGDFDDHVDAAGLYPLLENAVKWKPGDETGATIPDYDAIMKNPDDYRGQLFLIEGQFNGVPRSQDSLHVTGFARDGAWTDKIEKWDIVIDAGERQLVEIYLVNPPVPPKAGVPVRMPGRFYKVWRTEVKNGNGANADFLLFVGHSATIGRASFGRGGTDNYVALLVGMVLLMVIAFYILRGRIRRHHQPAPIAAATERVLRDRRADRAEADLEEEGETLPEDPVAALDHLQRRHWEDGTDPSTNTNDQ